MPPRLTVVLLSLLLATPVVIFWLLLVTLPERVAIQCPEECRCYYDGLYVDCSDSSLNSIPSILPTDVRHLLLENNSLTYFQNDSFLSKGLVELEIFDANYCKLIKIELGAFNGLTKLRSLFMRGNQISEIIPGTFQEIRRLEYLFLTNNRLEHLESDVFSGLINLKHIGLAGNKLQYLHPDTFLGLPNFQALYLSRNFGLQIPTDRHFINSHSLKFLYIAMCNIYSLSVETFANVSALKLLDISANYLRSVDINILKALPKLSTLYLFNNPLQCDCLLQDVWRCVQDHNIQTAYKGIAPECDTPSEVNGIWWGVLEKGQCLQDSIYYYGDYENTSYNYALTENMDTDTESQSDIKENTDTETKRFYNSVEKYVLPVVTVLFLFGITFNIILIIIITCNKDIRTVPNMYILNLAVSDIIILTLNLFYACENRFSGNLQSKDIECVVLPFCYRMSIGLSAYSIAVYSIQRYRVTVNPLQFHASSQPTWRATGATVCGVWIVAALSALPLARTEYFFCASTLAWRTNYFQLLAIFHLFVSCVLPLCVTAFSYIMMARHIFESSHSISEETQNSQLNARKNTANVLLALTVVLLISFVPYHIADVYYFFSIGLDFSIIELNALYNRIANLRYITSIVGHLLSVNSCLYPVVLFCTCRAFRTHFILYLSCCCKTNSPPTDFELANRN